MNKLNPQIHKSDTSNQEDHMFQSQELIASNQIPTKTDRKSKEKQYITIIQDIGITKYDERIYGKNGRNV